MPWKTIKGARVNIEEGKGPPELLQKLKQRGGEDEETKLYDQVYAALKEAQGGFRGGSYANYVAMVRRVKAAIDKIHPGAMGKRQIAAMFGVGSSHRATLNGVSYPLNNAMDQADYLTAVIRHLRNKTTITRVSPDDPRRKPRRSRKKRTIRKAMETYQPVSKGGAHGDLHPLIGQSLDGLEPVKQYRVKKKRPKRWKPKGTDPKRPELPRAAGFSDKDDGIPAGHTTSKSGNQ